MQQLFSTSVLLGAVAMIGSTAAQAPAGKCTFQNHTGFDKAKQVPGHRNDPAANEQECCNLCFAIKGCSGASFTSGQCYYKTIHEMHPRPLATATAVFGTWAPTPPAPPPPRPPPPPPPPPPGPPCKSFITKDDCPTPRCLWANGSCSAAAPPAPPPSPPAPPPPPMPPAPPPITPPACAAGQKPVQVFIMMGQSNMLGEGTKPGSGPNTLTTAVQTDKKYPYLWNASAGASGAWSTSPTVRNVFVMGGGGPGEKITLQNNEFMTGATIKPKNINGMAGAAKSSIGPELGIGFSLGGYTSEPVMTLKSCIGNRALGWDLLPPGSPRFEVNVTDPKDNSTTTEVYAGYHDTPHAWVKGDKNASKPVNWYGGVQYDGDTSRVYEVLGNFSDFYPGATCYKVAGFFWWQGDRDSRSLPLAQHYEENLVRMINTLRTQYSAPNAPFVAASLGQTVQGSTGGDGLILDAIEAVANATKYPEFKGNVAAVYTHPLEHTPGSSGAHYGRDAFTYMNVGEAMGMAMVGLLKGSE